MSCMYFVKRYDLMMEIDTRWKLEHRTVVRQSQWKYVAAAAARVPRQEVAFAAYGYSQHPSKPQSYFHDPLMAYQNLYQQGSNYGQGQGGSSFRYTPVVPNSLPRNNMRSSSNDAWIANTATNDSLLSQPMSIPENGFDFNVTSLEDSFRTSAMDPPQEKKKNDWLGHWMHFCFLKFCSSRICTYCTTTNKLRQSIRLYFV